MSKITDHIVDEVRKARDEYAKKFDYDIKAMCRDLKKRQSMNKDREIIKAPKRTKPPKTSV